MTEEKGKVKKPFYKRVWFIVLVALVALGLIGKLSSQQDWSNYSTEDKPQEEIVSELDEDIIVDTDTKIAEYTVELKTFTSLEDLANKLTSHALLYGVFFDEIDKSKELIDCKILRVIYEATPTDRYGRIGDPIEVAVFDIPLDDWHKFTPKYKEDMKVRARFLWDCRKRIDRGFYNALYQHMKKEWWIN